MRAVLGIVLFVLVSSSAPSVWAQSPSRASPPVRLIFPTCETLPFNRGQVAELLRVELADMGVRFLDVATPSVPAVPARPNDALALVMLAVHPCGEAASSVRIQILDWATSKAVERELLLSDIAISLRARAIAIAVVELLEASWAEALIRPERSWPVALPAATRSELAERWVPSIRAVKTPASPAWRLDAAVLSRLFPNRSTAILGGALDLGLWLSDRALASVGVEAGGGSTTVAQGDVSAFWLTADTGIALATADSIAEVGPHVLIGYAWAEGAPATDQVQAERHEGLVLAAVMRGSLRARMDETWAAHVAVDVGHTVRGITFLADETRAAGLWGVTAAVRVGVSITQ